MGAALTIVDETATGERLNTRTLELVSEKVTVAELIERRVRDEVRTFNEQADEDVFRGLVQPTGAEQTLNGFKVKKRKKVDADEQVVLALEAFERNGFLLLAGDQQLEELEAEIIVTGDLVVSFVKLVPLVGG